MAWSKRWILRRALPKEGLYRWNPKQKGHAVERWKRYIVQVGWKSIDQESLRQRLVFRGSSVPRIWWSGICEETGKRCGMSGDRYPADGMVPGSVLRWNSAGYRLAPDSSSDPILHTAQTSQMDNKGIIGWWANFLLNSNSECFV